MALHNLEQAAHHCARAGIGSVPNLDAVADFIRSEIAGNFRFDEEVKDDPASWISRAAAGLLMLCAPLYQCSIHSNGCDSSQAFNVQLSRGHTCAVDVLLWTVCCMTHLYGEVSCGCL